VCDAVRGSIHGETMIAGRRGEVVRRVAAPLVLVGQPRAQAVDIRAVAREGQIPEHVVKGPVLQHHDHNMVDLRQVRGTIWIALVNFHRCLRRWPGRELENR
jgi:hypothetical protein